MMSHLPEAEYQRGLDYWIGLAATITLVGMCSVRLLSTLDGVAKNIYFIFLVWVGVQLIAGLADRPRFMRVKIDDYEGEIVALVPAYNEDPEALRGCLQGFLEQTHKPDAVVVVDDGSTNSEFLELQAWFALAARAAGVRPTWVRQENAGKRQAQITGLLQEPDADIYITVDSDSILDRMAIENALRPMVADPRIQSVAAVILTTNYRESLLVRFMDVYCLGLQLFERSAFSRFDSVMVNSGGCAFYRGEVIRDNIEKYLSESLFGKPVHFSDDSLLTLFALERGKAIQQSNCFAFTLMPARFSHHRRQQVRWMRGSFIRSGWRMRFLPLVRPAYWLHLMKWITYATITSTLIGLSINGVFSNPLTILESMIAAISVYLITTVRYLAIRRSDQSVFQRLVTYSTAPLAGLWGWTFLRVLRWYAIATFWDLGWGTRSSVEVVLANAEVPPPD